MVRLVGPINGRIGFAAVQCGDGYADPLNVERLCREFGFFRSDSEQARRSC